MAARLTPAYQTFNTANGSSPLAGGKIHFYVSESVSTNKDTFSDSDLSTANTNPLILDSAGRVQVNVFGDGAYKMVVADSSDVVISTFDPVTGSFIQNRLDNIAALTALAKSTLTNTDQYNVSGYYAQGDGGGGDFYYDSTSTATANGGTIFATDEGGSGRWYRIVDSIINVRQFGAKGDGTTDDTATIQAAMNYAKGTTSVATLRISGGTYLITSLDYGTPTATERYNIVGDGRNKTKFLKTDATAEPMLTISGSGAASFVSEIKFSGFRMEGQVATTTSCIQSYVIANCNFEDLWLEKSVVCWQDFGSISSVWDNCVFNAGQFGYKSEWFDSSISAGDPNANDMTNCTFTNNTKWGIWFDDGRMLNIRGGRCEGDGQTALGSDYGGLFVGQAAGSRIGTENNLGRDRVDDEAATGYGRAVSVQDVWFESNTGNSDIWFNGGANIASGCYFRTGSTFNTQDIRISNGTYRLDGNIHSVDKTNVINEESGVIAGNIIVGCRFFDPESNINYDPDKTTLNAVSTRFTPSVIALGAFKIQGADNVVVGLGGNYRDTGITSITRSGVGIYDVVVATAWVLPNNPLVYIQALSGSGAALPVSYTVTAIGTDGDFTIQIRRLDGLTNPLYDPTVDSVDRDFQVIAYA